MNIKILPIICIFIMVKLHGGDIEGSLLKINSGSLQVAKVFLSTNEIPSMKEPPLSINSITYLCAINDTHLVIREGNVMTSDPSSPSVRVLGSTDITSGPHRFIYIACIDDGVMVVGIHIQQAEYLHSHKMSNAIYISFRGRDAEDIINAILLLSNKMEMRFDARGKYTPLNTTGFGKGMADMIEILRRQN
jgi:hypothetical protein